MILVSKSPTQPKALAGGKALAAALCKAYQKDPDAYRTGRKQMVFDRRSYGSAPIKSALSRDQHGKCCYCESKFTHVYTGDVEHFRPKGAVGRPSERITPGYYWLAYEWNNLFLSCATCNQTYKRDQFPLARESERARHHDMHLDREIPLLINPSGPINPRDHIWFNRDVPVGTTRSGEETIRVAGLDRENLTLRRIAHLRIMDTLCDAFDVLQRTPGAEALAAKVRSQVLDATSPQAEFSAATADLISKRRL